MSQIPSDATKEKLFDEFNTVVAETQQLLKSIAHEGGDKAGAFRANLEKGLATAGERLAKIREESLKQAGDAARATDEYVHENPWQVVGAVAMFAAIAGLFAGLLIARR
jgi:ElaB/YqjD/DUF883 family membrane-anchored ribosome-binding protein